MISNLAHRVARRFRRDGAILFRDAPSLAIRWSDNGTVTQDDIAHLVEPYLGAVSKVWLGRVGADGEHVYRWAARDPHRRPCGGTITLRTALEPGMIVCWAEVTIEGESGDRRRLATRHQLIDDRLQEVAARLRRLAVEARARPDVPAHVLADDLDAVIALAEGR